jgi:ribose/xylose/arabinose/galactoside ABC-type transport system permease subunit
MKCFRYVLIALALALIAYNATVLEPDNLLEGDSQIALIGILASASVIVLIAILIQSERIKKKQP